MNPRDYLVLYVDDEWPNRLVLEQTFEERFRVKAVASGDEALAVLAAEPVAVLLADQRMPGMSGEELLARAKRDYPDTVRMVLTAYGDVDPILRAVNDGLVSRYLIKPWDRGELEQVLLWGIHAYLLGREDSALRLRLLQTERLATLGSISAALIHDLTQPLASLDHNLERLEDLAGDAARLRGELERGDRGGPEAAPELGELATEMGEIAVESRRSSALMLHMTDSIRQFGRPGGAALPARCEPGAVIERALGLARDVAMRRRARLDYQGPRELPAVAISAVELTQVLLNLIINATQAIDRGGRSGRVTITAAATHELELAVADDGVGMTPEILARVGAPFFTTQPEGSGLGLAQCFRLVGRAGGRLALSSTPGQGTIARLAVPLAADDGGAAATTRGDG